MTRFVMNSEVPVSGQIIPLTPALCPFGGEREASRRRHFPDAPVRLEPF